MLLIQCIDRCLAFIPICVQWVECNPEPVTPCENEHEHELIFTPYIWDGNIADLTELGIVIFKSKLIRKPTGEPLTYVDIMKGFEKLFGVKLPKNIYSRKIRAMERKKNNSPLLERLLALYKQEVEKMYQ